MSGLPRLIAVEGPIGVGKTTLAKRLAAQLGADVLLERPEENPFLPRFYEDPGRGALPTQLYFLLQRVRQLTALTGDSRRPRIADFMLAKDRLFARLTLDGADYALYEQVRSRLAFQAPGPDLVLYLHAPVPVLLERIRKRGITYEQGISTGYLARLCTAYAEFFQDYREAPVMTVDTSSANFADAGTRLDGLVAGMTAAHGSRHSCDS